MSNLNIAQTLRRTHTVGANLTITSLIQEFCHRYYGPMRFLVRSRPGDRY